MITFHLKPEHGETFDLEGTSRDVLLWERTTKGAQLAKIETDLKMSDLYKIAYFAMKRTRGFDGTQTEFEETYDLDFDMEEEPDPTREDR